MVTNADGAGVTGPPARHMPVPYIVAAALGAAGLATALHLAGAPDPFSASSALVLAVAIVLFTIIATSGLLINRGRWARVLSLCVVTGFLSVAAITALRPLSIVSVVLALLALFGLVGRWLDGWIRLRPSATGPGPRVAGLLLGTLALVPAVAVAAPSGLEAGHGVLGSAAVVLAWGYGKARTWALWGLRLALPLLAVPAMLAGPVAGSVLLGAHTGVLVALAWTAEARLAVTPVFDRPPGPRRGSAGSAGGSDG